MPVFPKLPVVLRCGKCGSTRVVNDLNFVRIMAMPQTHRCLDCGYIGMYFLEEEKVDKKKKEKR